MSNLYDASKQWAMRPPDERFNDLESLHSFTKERKDNSSERVVKVNNQDIIQEQDGSLSYRDTINSRLSNWAFSQLCQSASVPARYLRTLPPSMARDCLGHSVGQSKNEFKILTRSNGIQVAAAFTGPKYGRIWDSDIVSKVMESVRASDWKTPGGGLYASDRDVFIFMINDRDPIRIGDAELGQGFFCWNSEVGSASFGLTTFLYNYVCANHIVWGVENVKELRIIHRKNAFEHFQNFAIPKLNELVSSKENESRIKEVVSKAMFGKIANDLDGTLDYFKNKPFTKSEITNAWETGIKENNDVTTPWGLLQGFTAHARSIPHMNQRVNLERRASVLLK